MLFSDFLFSNASGNMVLERYNFPTVYPQNENLRQYVQGFLHCAQGLSLASF